MTQRDRFLILIVLTAALSHVLGNSVTWFSLFVFAIFDKKCLAKIREIFISLRPFNFSVMKNRLTSLEVRVDAVRRGLFDSTRGLSARISNLRQVSEAFETKLRLLELRISGNNSQQGSSNSNILPQGVYNVPSHDRVSTPPALNTRSKSSNSSATGEIGKTRKVTFNLRHGSRDAPVVSQKFYFRCQLCLVEEFLSYRNLNDLCNYCKPVGSRDKVSFVRIFHDNRMWLCSCFNCKNGQVQNCKDDPCPECSNFRTLVERQPE